MPRTPQGEGKWATGFIEWKRDNYIPDPTFEALKRGGIDMDVPLLTKVLQSQVGRKRNKQGIYLDEEKGTINPRQL